jgi:hypothetical protein
MEGRCEARLVSTALAAWLAQPGPVGRVHSVFPGALNLAFDQGLVTLVRPSAGMPPNGILLDQEVDVATLGLRPGALVRIDHQAVWDNQGRLVVDLRGARPWSPVVEPGACRPRPLPQVMRPLTEALARTPVSGGLSALLHLFAQDEEAPMDALPRTCAAASPAIRRVMDGARTDSLDLALDGARGLIGLGEGLTPSGDDFLVGFSAALRATGSPLDPAFAQSCAGLARGRTTRIAETFHAHAARGEYGERIHRLLGALARADNPSDELTVALSWGGTSGADTLLGVLVQASSRSRVSTMPWRTA